MVRLLRAELIDDDVLRRMVVRRPLPDKLIEALRRAPLVEEGVIDQHSRYVDCDLLPTELVAVKLASFGLTDSEIADVLGRSLHSVKSQMKRAMRKLRAKNRTHLVAISLRQGVIE